MDGQGPEHSQGRIERFLQLCDDTCDEEQQMTLDEQLRKCNIQVIYCSTTSNYFHALRRQLNRDYRKPLIAFNSKKLLKFKGVILLIFRLMYLLLRSLRALTLFLSTQILRLMPKRSKKYSSVVANSSISSRTKEIRPREM